MTHKPEYHQRRVSDDPDRNNSLSDKDRIENLEFDSAGQWVILARIVEQNEKYNEYLDKKIKAEENGAEFWRKQLEMIVSGGIKGSVLALFAGLLYAFIHWVKTL